MNEFVKIKKVNRGGICNIKDGAAGGMSREAHEAPLNAAERERFCKGMAKQVAKGMPEQVGGQDDAEHCGCRHEDEASKRERKIREALEKLRKAAGR